MWEVVVCLALYVKVWRVSRVESETNGEHARENRFETLDSVDSEILTKV